MLPCLDHIKVLRYRDSLTLASLFYKCFLSRPTIKPMEKRYVPHETNPKSVA